MPDNTRGYWVWSCNNSCAFTSDSLKFLNFFVIFSFIFESKKPCFSYTWTWVVCGSELSFIVSCLNDWFIVLLRPY